jgi:hypothetical protein
MSLGAEGELEETLEAAAEDKGEEETWCVIYLFVKCSNKSYKCAVNPVINLEPVCKSRTPIKYMAILILLKNPTFHQIRMSVFSISKL